MKAEDTVMDYDLKLCHSLVGRFSLAAIKDVVDEECLAQAEITWDIAIQQGRKEVMDWIKEVRGEEDYTDDKHQMRTSILLDKESFVAKKKEWGIE